MPASRLSILGLGLLGGSIGLAVKRGLTDCDIVGYDPNPASVRAAKEIGAIDHAADSIADAVTNANLVILAAPVGRLPAILADLAPHLRPDAVVTDVGSTKDSVVVAAGLSLRDPTRFVGSHPMAGREKSGIRAAQANLFDDALCLMTPIEQTDPVAERTVEAFWMSLGMRTRKMLPDDHDRLVAAASHLPHAIASTLFATMSDEAVSIAGRGLADTTRIAASDAVMWRDIFTDNVDNLRESIDAFRRELDHFESLLDPTKAQALHDYLLEVAHRRRAMR